MGEHSASIKTRDCRLGRVSGLITVFQALSRREQDCCCILRDSDLFASAANAAPNAMDGGTCGEIITRSQIKRSSVSPSAATQHTGATLVAGTGMTYFWSRRESGIPALTRAVCCWCCHHTPGSSSARLLLPKNLTHSHRYVRTPPLLASTS